MVCTQFCYLIIQQAHHWLVGRKYEPWHDPNTRCLCITKENDEYKDEKHLILFRLIEWDLVVTAYVDINTK